MLLDTHVIYWWIDGGRKLSTSVDELLRSAESTHRILWLCPISFWELRYKEVRGSFAPKLSLRKWLPLFQSMEHFSLAPADVETWLLAAELRWNHRDPADRLIAATAMRLGVPIITKDQAFHRPDCPVEAIWE